ncbi:MAG TPA: UDP-N-acetylmuramoyl-L-alanyl-D-glutamate--2,6-diaminopimelate ligase [bacterium]|nr:UDP-N-acetylmuramoyl-L-alanyl-D-glutamate--2,6-diaminopimelate ligase [bacterium]
MKLTTLLQAVPGASITRGPTDAEISSIALDSRRAGPGALFVAVKGTKADGATFAADAAKRGAVAVASEEELELPPGVCAVRVPQARRAAALLAARMVGDPSRSMAVYGITGTNGKTTGTYLAEGIFRAHGGNPGVIGTVAYRYNDVSKTADNTTPDAVLFQGLLAEMRIAGVTHVSMEVSSHALDQERVAGTAFDVVHFTNLTRDHMDYHGSMEAYAQAKRRLFSEFLAESPKSPRAAIANLDDEYGASMLAAAPVGVKRLSYSRDRAKGADVFPVEVVADDHGTRGRFATPLGPVRIDSPLVGAYNLSNLLGAICTGIAFGIPPSTIDAGLSGNHGAPGRMEKVANGRGVTILVDYAHTPDALENVLVAVKGFARRRVICVFGCGGDRDRTKRPIMGGIACRLADVALVTSDNPRTENPDAIVAEIVTGCTGTRFPSLAAAKSGTGFFVEVDRARAIAAAASIAERGDVVVIAGKGHEDYQIVGTTKHHFDDREEAERAFA